MSRRKIRRNKNKNKQQQETKENKFTKSFKTVGNKVKTAGMSTGHGLAVGLKATGRGLSTAGKWTAAKMMLLIEKIKSLRSQVDELNNECADLAAQMQLELDKAEMIQISKELEAKAKQLRKLAKNLHKLENVAKEKGVEIPLETQTA